jgi:aspartate carbamoyltransferase regulatory subunit
VNIDSIQNGIVLDHIKAGKAMEIYKYLRLKEKKCSVAMIMNVKSSKMGFKDIIKIDTLFPVNLDVLGYIDQGITVNIIENGALKEKKKLSLPQRIKGIIKCKNPRCITSTEQEIVHEFFLSETGDYRCIYCEAKSNERF